MRTPKPEPRCARCNDLAADLHYLDNYWAEAQEQIDAADEEERRRQRVEYIQCGDGTYNQATGSFWCDPCYIAIGCPLGVAP